MKSLLLAVGFLTAIPVRTRAPAPAELGRSAMCFPLVGLGLGLLLGGAQALLVDFLPPLVTATLLVALWAALTGGLHLDGLADSADGLLATASRERRLEILRDPRLGAFGVIGLTLFLLLKVHAVGALIDVAGDVSGGLRRGWFYEELPAALLRSTPLITSAVFARWVILIVGCQPSARSDGSAVDFARGLGVPVFGVAAVIPLALIVVGTVFDGWTVLHAVILAHVVALVVILFARRRLGGVTGDVLGLTVELVELAVLLVFVASPSFVKSTG